MNFNISQDWIDTIASFDDVMNPMKNIVTRWINPFQFSISIVIGLAFLKFVAEIAVDEILCKMLLWMNWPKLPSRVPVPIQKGLVKLEMIDYCYLLINQFVEFAFISNFAYLALRSEKAMLPLDELSLVNTVVAFYSIIYIDDFIYFWAHRFMHVRWFYPLVHKHHHRQTLPVRGYLDAANEHPIEQVIGLSIVWLTLNFVSDFVGLHSLTVLVFFAWYALCSMLNHTEFDVNFGIFGVGYSVRAHETHHRMFTCNYAQVTMFWDHLFGTFREYKEGSRRSKTSEKDTIKFE